MIGRRILVATCIALTLAAPVWAQENTACSEQFVDGQAPKPVNLRLLTRSAELCYSAFAIFHSGLTRTPLWVAEHLTAESLQSAAGLEREDEFYPESALAGDERAELADYSRSGYDRGHMAPAADMPNELAMQQSFTLANIVPQKAKSNRYLWKDIESLVRNLARERGEIYVVTGPAFLGTTVEAIGERVAVPTHLYKAVFDPETGEAGAYITTNSDAPQWQRVSIEQLTAAISIDVFPSIPTAAKAEAMALPDLSD